MTDLNKRRLVQWAGASALAAGLAALSPVHAAEPLKAAWIYVGPVGNAGWSFAHDLGRKAVEAKFGAKVKATIVEAVPEGAVMVNLKIARFNPDDPEAFTETGGWQSFRVPCLPTDRLLNLLIYVKSYLDGTLTMRRSCAHGV